MNDAKDFNSYFLLITLTKSALLIRFTKLVDKDIRSDILKKFKGNSHDMRASKFANK